MKVQTHAIQSTADFSPCSAYRYALERRFMFGEGMLNFIMLNPSTADEDFNDPTVGRCERFALRHGFERLVITNLFAYRATDPADMKIAHVRGQCVTGGSKNDQAIAAAACRAKMVICAWGNHGSFLQRAHVVRAMLQAVAPGKLHYLELNQSGEPKHPLYVAGSREPVLWGLA